MLHVANARHGPPSIAVQFYLALYLGLLPLNRTVQEEIIPVVRLPIPVYTGSNHACFRPLWFQIFCKLQSICALLEAVQKRFIGPVLWMIADPGRVRSFLPIHLS